MASKDILFHRHARAQIASGLDTLANAVKVTLGPRGRNVVLERSWGSPTITKDGVTVAKEIELENRLANMGAQMVKEVASRTSEVAGDGTTTATVLAQAIFAEGAKLVAAGIDPLELKRGIDSAVKSVVADLARQSNPTRGREEIAQVGTISANGDVTIGNLIAEAMEKVGREGVVTLEESQTMETTLEVVEGLKLDRGYLSAYFVTDAERMEVVLHEPYILICEKRLSAMKDLVPLLEAVIKESKPLLIVAEDVDGEALATLVVNKLRGQLEVCAIKAPGFGNSRREALKDLSVLTAAQVLSDDLGTKMENLTLQELGRAKRVTVTKDDTILLEGGGKREDVEAHAKTLRAQMEVATIADRDRDNLQARLAKIAGGIAVIKIGAATETEMKEKKARVEDALNATRAAVEEGIVPGGGVALLRALPALEKLELNGDQRYGLQVIRRALEEPLRQIAANAGAEGGVVVAKVREGMGAYGFNALSGVYEDLIEAGVIDPTKVVRVALQNAASVASLMLTTEALIATQVD